ncbi:YadA-like family protein [Methylobacterium sp. A54F]
MPESAHAPRRPCARRHRLAATMLGCGLALPPFASATAQYAAGSGAAATGARATAVGDSASAAGDNATALGGGATARTNGIAIGPGATANEAIYGTNIAIGSGATATSPRPNGPLGSGDNLAIGTASRATGLDTMAIGAQTTASGDRGIAIGNNFTMSSTADSVVLGLGSTATGASAGSTVLGNSAGSAAAGGVALGFQSMALRGGLNGAEAFSGTTVRSTLGAVAVGNAGAPDNLRQITNLAGGTQATDAVNLRQLSGAANTLAGAVGGGAAFDAAGTFTGPRFVLRGGTYTDVGGALGGLDAALGDTTASLTALGNTINTINTNGTRYLAVRATGPAAQAAGTDSVALGGGAAASTAGGVALGSGSRADRAGLSGGAEAFSGTAVGSDAGAVSVGAAGAERQITNLAGGTADTDAVNLRQLRAAGSALAGALGGGAAFDAAGRFTGPSYTVQGSRYDSAGAAISALDRAGVQYDVDPATGLRGNRVTLTGGDPNQPVLLRNVAAGTADTDAANVGQVAAARGESFAYTDRRVAAAYTQSTRYTDQRFAALDQRIGALGSDLAQVRGEARRAAAIGLAAASLRFDDRPGKLSVAAGGGAWRGESAGAFGIGYTLPDGSGRLNATGATTGRDFGFGAGASFTFN